MVGAASAQEVEVAATQGILIRVDAPKANEWAAIGDTIRIRILCYDGRLDQGFRVAVVDSSVADADVGSAADIPNKIYYNYANGDPQVTAGTAGTSGVDTFKVKIGVAATANFLESNSNHALKVVVSPTAATDGPLNNLMRNRKITPATAGFGATRVGDGKLFGVDGARPVHADVFTSIALDLDRLNTVMNDTAGSGTTVPPLIQAIRINTDDVFRAVLHLNTAQILGARADRIEVGLVPVDSIARYVRQTTDDPPGLGLTEEQANAAAFKDDALVKLMLRGDRLYSPNPGVEQKIEAGQIGDNQRLELFAYLVDVAGNVGGTATAPEAASWKTLHGTTNEIAANTANPTVAADAATATNVPIIGDATAPVITINYPNPDSIEAGSHDARIAAARGQVLREYTALPGETQFHFVRGFPTNPLSFDMSEIPDSLRITHGDSTYSLGSGAVDDPDTQFDEDGPPTARDGRTETLRLWPVSRGDTANPAACRKI